MRHLAGWILCCWGWAAAAGAGELEWPVARGPAPMPAAVEFSPRLVDEAPPAMRLDYPACHLYSGTTYLVEPDGTQTSTFHELVRLNHRAAVETHGEWPLVFQPAFQTLTLHRARVHKPDGAALDVGPAQVRVRDVNHDYKVIEEYREAIVSFPQLAPGDVIEVWYSVRGRDPEFGREFCALTVLNDFGIQSDEGRSSADEAVPYHRTELRVRLPADRTLHHAAFGRPLEPEVRRRTEVIEYLWRADDLYPPSETLAPAPADAWRVGVHCSTFADWQAVANWKRGLRADRRACPPELRTEVEAIVRAAPTETERARRLARLVRDRVRYLSVGHGVFGSRPHAPAEVWAQGYGDCKDASHLLSVLYEAAGITHETASVMTAASGRVDRRIPSPAADHVFLRVVADGQTHWVDPTNTYAPWNALREDCFDRPAYFVSADGVRLGRTPRATADDYRLAVRSYVDVGSDGAARVRVEQEAHGVAAARLRQQLAARSRAGQQELIWSDYRTVLDGARLVRFAVAPGGLDDADRPLRVEFEYRVDGWVGPPADADAPLREATLSEAQLWNVLLWIAPDADRTGDLHLPRPFDLTHTVRVTAPAAWRWAHLPGDTTDRTRWGYLLFTSQPVGGAERQARLAWHVRCDEPRVAAEELERWREFRRRAWQASSQTLALRRTAELADLRRLEGRSAWQPADVEAALALSNLYLDAAEPQRAAEVVRRALAAVPGDRLLREQAVIVARSPVEAAEAYAELVRRWPDEPQLALLEAGNWIVAGRLDEARRALRSLRATPTSGFWGAWAEYLEARMLLVEKRFTAARAAIDRAWTEPRLHTLAEAVLVRAQVLAATGAGPEALVCLERGLAEAPTDEGLLAEAALRAHALGEADAARGFLVRLAAAAADDPAALVRAASVHRALGREEECHWLARRALALDPNLPEARELAASTKPVVVAKPVVTESDAKSPAPVAAPAP